jgi:putative MFS transporter
MFFNFTIIPYVLMIKTNQKKEIMLIVVAALGYFVDIYDLILFSIIRKSSLMGLGLTAEQCLPVGEQLISIQMIGMLIGGVLWGVLGDKKGRLSVLFGSIILYSFANIANGMVDTIEAYAFWRFVAGIGLAGELGAGITLVSEVMSKENRGYGTMAVTTFGVLGGVVAGLIGNAFDWRISYYIGGSMGLALLLLRIGVYESGMYQKTELQNVSRGNFLSLFTQKDRFLKYLKCIVIGLPTWYFVGILITFSPEFATALGVENIQAGTSVIMFYGGLAVGDFLSGLISQLMSSRRKVVKIFVLSSLVMTSAYLFLGYTDPFVFYFICFFLGVSAGYWALFVTIASEQFGTNLRSTVTTTVPNFARGALVLLLLIFDFFKRMLPNAFPAFFTQCDNCVIIYSAFAVGIIAIVLSFWAVHSIEETFGKDLDYVEG